MSTRLVVSCSSVLAVAPLAADRLGVLLARLTPGSAVALVLPLLLIASSAWFPSARRGTELVQLSMLFFAGAENLLFAPLLDGGQFELLVTLSSTTLFALSFVATLVFIVRRGSLSEARRSGLRE